MPFPTITTCLVCEQARPEIGNKFILLGFFGVAPNVRIHIQDFQKPIQVCFVFCGGSGSGHYVVGMRLTAPNGQTFDAPTIEGNLMPQFPTSNFFMGFQGVLPAPGTYTATLLVNGTSNFHTTFVLENPPAAATPAVIPGVGQPN